MPRRANRKSYVSFTDGGSCPAAVGITDPDGNTTRTNSYNSTGSGSSQEPQQALINIEEEVDEQLESFLVGDSWNDKKWTKRALIGQGSFASVYLVMHTVTTEFLAVKQFEAPTTRGPTAGAIHAKRARLTPGRGRLASYENYDTLILSVPWLQLVDR